jgi:hypothetical protein
MTIGSGGRVVRIALFAIGAVGIVLIGVLYWPWPYTALAVILVLLIAIIVPLEQRAPGKKL